MMFFSKDNYQFNDYYTPSNKTLLKVTHRQRHLIHVGMVTIYAMETIKAKRRKLCTVCKSYCTFNSTDCRVQYSQTVFL